MINNSRGVVHTRLAQNSQPLAVKMQLQERHLLKKFPFQDITEVEQTTIDHVSRISQSPSVQMKKARPFLLTVIFKTFANECGLFKYSIVRNRFRYRRTG